jgi:hypothetical protein
MKKLLPLIWLLFICQEAPVLAVTQLTDSLVVRQGAKMSRLWLNTPAHGTVNDTILVGAFGTVYYRTIGEILATAGGDSVRASKKSDTALDAGKWGGHVWPVDSVRADYKADTAIGAKHADTTRGAYTAALWANHAYAGPYVTNSNMSGTSNTLGMFTGTNSMGNSLLAQSGSQTQTASSFQVGTTGYSATPAQLSLGDISNTGNSRPVIIGAWGAGGSWGIGPKSYSGNYDVQIGNVTASATDWAASQVTKLWCTFFGGTADSAVAADRARKLSTARVIGKSTTFDGTANIVPDSAISVAQSAKLTTARIIGKSTTFDGTAAIIPDSSLDAPMWAGRTWGTSVALADSSRLGTYRYAKTDAVNGLLKCNGSGTYSAITDNSGNWNSAYGWGNWASNFGTTSGTITQGNDSRLSDSRAPNGSASGDLTGSYPGPSVAHTNTSTLLLGDSLNVHGTIIQKNGNVGIGTTNPSAKLHLNGSTLTWAVQTSGAQVIGYAANQALGVGTALAIAGNVGIGTTAPTEELTVKGNISDTGNGLFTGTVTATGGFVGNVTGNTSGSSGSCTGNAATATLSDSSKKSYPTSSASGDLTGSYPGPTVAHTNTSTLLLGDSLNVHGTIIQKNGNVGIGTTNPSAKLHLNGLALTWAVQTSGAQVIGYAANQALGVGTALAIAGNVGIGTTAPTEELTVKGNISDTGNITTTGTVTSNASGQSIKGGAWSWMGDYGGQPSIGSTVGSIAVRTTDGEAAYFSASETDIDGTLHAPSQNISGNDTVGGTIFQTGSNTNYFNSPILCNQGIHADTFTTNVSQSGLISYSSFYTTSTNINLAATGYPVYVLNMTGVLSTVTLTFSNVPSSTTDSYSITVINNSTHNANSFVYSNPLYGGNTVIIPVGGSYTFHSYNGTMF